MKEKLLSVLVNRPVQTGAGRLSREAGRKPGPVSGMKACPLHQAHSCVAGRSFARKVRIGFPVENSNEIAPVLSRVKQ